MAMNTSEAIYRKGMGQGAGGPEYELAIRHARGAGLVGGPHEIDQEYEDASRMDEHDSLVIRPSSFRIEGGELVELQGDAVVERKRLADVEEEIAALLDELKEKEEAGNGITLDDISYLDVKVATLVAQAREDEVIALHDHDPALVDSILYQIATEAEVMLSKAGAETQEDDTAEVVAQIEATENMIVLFTEKANSLDLKQAEGARTRRKIARVVRADLLAHLNAGELERLYALAA